MKPLNDWIRTLGLVLFIVGLPLAVYNVLYLAFTPQRRLLVEGTRANVTAATVGIILSVVGFWIRRSRRATRTSMATQTDEKPRPSRRQAHASITATTDDKPDPSWREKLSYIAAKINAHGGHLVVIGVVAAFVVMGFQASQRQKQAKKAYVTCYWTVLDGWIDQGVGPLAQKERRWLADEYMFGVGTREDLISAQKDGIDVSELLNDLEKRQRHAELLSVTPSDLVNVDRLIRRRCGE